ncbi:Response regulator MprA [Candidatus Hydrogenisulfobacillus filiaventi]|uniref:Stage 0 sporulation protein A homolog n=1 Tax=Candidatus Hydrogenisulfobacillus filiaventi TaxID=2707344 RepID=A0A6F8ZJ31_9FIRM|nr:response regulator transcription factor [Bacillota bacterium]CAB1129999.1 Response regulator MprA [Candidatus Hydrogenisulfobacillus filiaventi]
MRTLLIEDDERVARLVTLSARHAGWEVEWRARGQEGLEEALNRPYDVIVLDLMLPDMDGLTVCRDLRAANVAVPLLMLTARDAVADRVMGLDAGADDYLTKPFAMTELLARMRALSRRPPHVMPADECLTAGAIELSVLRRQVTVAGEPVELTKREFDLLHYFMQNVGITLTRDMILERVWGWGFGGTSNIVDVYVGYLRNKLDRPGAPCPIVTVRGVGYALRPESAETGQG